MDDEPTTVPERGLLATSDEVWNLAVRRAEVIGRLAQAGVVGLEAADAAAAELGCRGGWRMCCCVAGGKARVLSRT
jgi:hypothetical protein